MGRCNAARMCTGYERAENIRSRRNEFRQIAELISRLVKRSARNFIAAVIGGRPTYCICSVRSRADLINVSKRTRVNENYIRVTNIYGRRIRGAYLRSRIFRWSGRAVCSRREIRRQCLPCTLVHRVKLSARGLARQKLFDSAHEEAILSWRSSCGRREKAVSLFATGTIAI